MAKYSNMNQDDLELRHHVFYYTFLPTVAISGVMILSSMPLWYFEYITASVALALPWAALSIACGYIVCFGDYSMPAETYRKVKSGEWNFSE